MKSRLLLVSAAIIVIVGIMTFRFNSSPRQIAPILERATCICPAKVEARKNVIPPARPAIKPFKKAVPRLAPHALARWLEMEEMGYVPDEADVSDWQIASLTSWWGKPIDPVSFWRNRTIWLDAESCFEAERRGRMFPPIPPGDHYTPTFHDRPKVTSRGPEEAMPYSECTSEENWFWDQWARTHPYPPDRIHKAQVEVAGKLAKYKERHTSGDAGRSYSDREFRSDQEREIRSCTERGFPHEAFTESALGWALVMETRAQQLRDEKEGSTQPGILSSTLEARLSVDAQYALRDLTAEERRAADAWKPPYLRRLRTEKADEMYIQAYRKAWNLNEKEVFGP